MALIVVVPKLNFTPAPLGSLSLDFARDLREASAVAPLELWRDKQRTQRFIFLFASG
jgi:hypothetical protein